MIRRRKRRKIAYHRVAVLAVAALAVPLAVRYCAGALVYLSSAGESAALLAASIQMPEGSAQLLRDRFRAEIYNPEGEHATGDRVEGRPLPGPGYREDPVDEPEPAGDDTGPSETGARIPAEYAAPIINENFAGYPGGTSLQYGMAYIRNETSWDDADVEDILGTEHGIRFSGGDEPQVLIVHTHATESFELYDSPTYDTRNTWRSTDNRGNMVAVGDAFAQVLEDSGIGVIHDTTQHDYPSYNGSYERSAVTIQKYLEEYPSIKVVLDLHRDAMQRGDAIVKPVAMIDGKKAAQIMIISACDDGTMDVPQWRENLRFAAAYQEYMEQYYPGLTRPVYLCYRKYNMDLTTGSLLLEFGSNANTLDEAVYSATMAAEALVQLIEENREIYGEKEVDP